MDKNLIKSLNRVQLGILLTLSFHANEITGRIEKNGMPLNKTEINRILNLNNSTVKKHFDELQTKGFIVWKRQKAPFGNESINIYHLNLELILKINNSLYEAIQKVPIETRGFLFSCLERTNFETMIVVDEKDNPLNIEALSLLEKASIRTIQRYISSCEETKIFAQKGRGKKSSFHFSSEIILFEKNRNEFDPTFLKEERESKEFDLVIKEKRNKTEGYIYFLKENFSGSVKIGMTRNLKTRMSTFNVKLPFETDILHIMKTKDMRETEKFLHKYFADKRRKGKDGQFMGEWFDLSEYDIEIIKSEDFSALIQKELISNVKKREIA